LLKNNIPNATVDKDPIGGHHHLSQLYKIANPDFTGVVSVPLLWDKKNNTAVSNSSLGLVEMFVAQLKPHLATRNQHIELYPDKSTEEDLAKEHTELVKWIHSNVTTAVYKIARIRRGELHDEMIEDYYNSLLELQNRLIENDTANNESSLSYLMGDKVRCADILLWISLVRLDLCYQFRFGLGKFSIREGKKIRYRLFHHCNKSLITKCILFISNTNTFKQQTKIT
jgi:putative glutathione S-transferase